MTRRAIIPQDDITRAVKAAFAADPRSRVIIDLQRQRIEIVFGAQPEADSQSNPWEEDHGQAQEGPAR